MEATTSIGMRPAQEDRVLVCPYMGCKQTVLAGVFDGTVGDATSEYVHRNFVDNLKTEEVSVSGSIVYPCLFDGFHHVCALIPYVV